MVVLTTIVGGITPIPHGNQDLHNMLILNLHFMARPLSHLSYLSHHSQSPPFEQAILDLTWIVDDFVEENKEINAHSNQKIITVEDNLNKKIDGLKNDYEHKWDNLQDSIEDLINQQQCPPEEECQSDTMAEEQCQQQPHEELIEDFIELSE